MEMAIQNSRGTPGKGLNDYEISDYSDLECTMYH
jgi:hypothetical protein